MFLDGNAYQAITEMIILRIRQHERQNEQESGMRRSALFDW